MFAFSSDRIKEFFTIAKCKGMTIMKNPHTTNDLIIEVETDDKSIFFSVSFNDGTFSMKPGKIRSCKKLYEEPKKL